MAMLAMVMRSSMVRPGRARAVPLHGAVGRAVKADFADDVQDHVLGHDAAGQLAFEVETHRFGHLDEQFARAHDEARIRIADARGEFAKSARHAGVRVRAEEHLARPRVALGRQRRVADPREAAPVLALELALARVELPGTVLVVDHVVEIGQTLLLDEGAQRIHVAVGHAVGRENVVIGDDHDLLAIPDLGVAAEFAVKHPDRARSAHIVCEQHVGVHPHVFARGDTGAAARAGKDFFRQRHVM